MIDRIAHHVRSTVLAVAAPDLSDPIERSFVAPGEGWSREGCRTWVVHYVTSRWETVGAGRVPAQQGAGFAGALAGARTFDMAATFVACGHPTSVEAEPAPAAEIDAWAREFLADVDVFERALAAVTIPVDLSGVPGQKLSLGNNQPAGPGIAGAGIARVIWPFSVSVY